jgi:hypothetical protein
MSTIYGIFAGDMKEGEKVPLESLIAEEVEKAGLQDRATMRSTRRWMRRLTDSRPRTEIGNGLDFLARKVFEQIGGLVGVLFDATRDDAANGGD